MIGSENQVEWTMEKPTYLFFDWGMWGKTPGGRMAPATNSLRV